MLLLVKAVVDGMLVLTHAKGKASWARARQIELGQSESRCIAKDKLLLVLELLETRPAATIWAAKGTEELMLIGVSHHVLHFFGAMCNEADLLFVLIGYFIYDRRL